MLLELIKKAHKKIVFGGTGIISIITLLMPVAFIVIGIILQINIANGISTGGNQYYGYLWIGLGVFTIIFSFNKFKDFLGLFKYIFKPEEYQTVKNLIDDGVNINEYDFELKENDVLNKLNKENPIIFTEHLIIGFTNYSFFILRKDDIVWAYEYNGNGIVFMDKHKAYGFTFFPQVDRNDEIMEQLKIEMPYIYLGIDFDYKTIMHDDFDNTLLLIQNEKQKFLDNPDKYRIEKEEKEKEKALEAEKKLEEERQASIKEIEEEAGEKIDKE